MPQMLGYFMQLHLLFILSECYLTWHENGSVELYASVLLELLIAY